MCLSLSVGQCPRVEGCWQVTQMTSSFDRFIINKTKKKKSHLRYLALNYLKVPRSLNMDKCIVYVRHYHSKLCGTSGRTWRGLTGSLLFYLLFLQVASVHVVIDTSLPSWKHMGSKPTFPTCQTIPFVLL